MTEFSCVSHSLCPSPESTLEAAAGTCHAWAHIWQHGCRVVRLPMTPGTAMGTPAKADCVPWTWPNEQESCLIA